MRIEAFSEGKNLDHPEANEDQFVIVPGRGYAVIDGVTDISGREVDGMRTGRYAARIVQRTVAAIVCEPASALAAPDAPAALVSRISAALHAQYADLGIVDEVRADPPRRFGATLALALDLGATFRFILVGDSGVRLNEAETFVDGAYLDRVTAVLRQEAYRIVRDAGGQLDAQRSVGRLCSYYGAAALHPGMQPWLAEADRALLHERSVATARRLFPAAPESDIIHLVDLGISGQTRFQNNTSSPFSYSVFDGFDVPMELVQLIDRPRESIRSIELFTDGYFKPGAAAGIAAWEASFEEVERIDPEKIVAWPSCKGSEARLRTDDRTVVIVHV
jgi:hypothetical protein